MAKTTVATDDNNPYEEYRKRYVSLMRSVRRVIENSRSLRGRK